MACPLNPPTSLWITGEQNHLQSLVSGLLQHAKHSRLPFGIGVGEGVVKQHGQGAVVGDKGVYAVLA
jgi:hypothetical protein